MPSRNDRAIVLHLSDYSETSQIVSLFTAGDGQVRLIAKGARRNTKTKFAVGLDLLELGDVRYIPPGRDASLGTLAEWVQRDAFTGLRGELVRMYGGLYAAEAVQLLTQEYDAHETLFDALLTLLQQLSGVQGTELAKTGAETRPMAHLVRFQAGLLKAIGYAPILRRCCVCGSRRQPGRAAYFSSAAGGYVCDKCAHQPREKRSIAARMLDAPAPQQDPVEWFHLLDYHITHIVSRRLRSAASLDAALSRR